MSQILEDAVSDARNQKNPIVRIVKNDEGGQYRKKNLEEEQIQKEIQFRLLLSSSNETALLWRSDQLKKKILKKIIVYLLRNRTRD